MKSEQRLEALSAILFFNSEIIRLPRFRTLLCNITVQSAPRSHCFPTSDPRPAITDISHAGHQKRWRSKVQQAKRKNSR